MGDLGSIPGLGRSPGEGKGYSLQYSGLENSMDCIIHGVTKSWTQLSDFHFNMFYPLSLPSSTFCSQEFYGYPYLTDFKTGALETTCQGAKPEL